jgi:hypothetical protein
MNVKELLKKFLLIDNERRKKMNLKSRIAISLIERGGIVVSKPVGGSDYVMSPAEIVGRAMEIAERAVEEMTALGWITEE